MIPIRFLSLSQDITICSSDSHHWFSTLVAVTLRLNSGSFVWSELTCDGLFRFVHKRVRWCTSLQWGVPVPFSIDTMRRYTFHSHSDHSWQAVNTKVRISPLDGLLPCLSLSLIYCFYWTRHLLWENIVSPTYRVHHQSGQFVFFIFLVCMHVITNGDTFR